jgi:hypothetical protein
VSLPLPESESAPIDGVHWTACGAVVSLHSTTLKLPVKHGSFTVAKPLSIVACPLQVPPELKVKPPLGLHAVIVAGGGGGAE